MEHKKIDLGNVHKPHNWEFADATARLAAVISDSDMIGALALQLNTGSYWRLSATLPATAWELAATGNQADAYLLDRTNHTGSQAISTITGLQSALDGKITFASVLTGLSLATGGALLSTDTVLEALGKLGHHVADTNNPHNVTKAQVGLGSVENKSSATIRGEITSLNVTGALGFTPADAAIIGQANGIAPLDSTGKLASSYLPGYVDDVIEGANLAAFPATGESGKMYVALDSGKVYRWSGSTYIEISGSPGSTDAVPEGSVNLYWTNARTIGSVLTGLSTGTSGALASTDTVLQALGKLEATKITSTVSSLTPAGGVLYVGGHIAATGGPVTASHASAEDNNAGFTNTHDNGYGFFSRGGFGSRYAALFLDKNANQLMLLSGSGALTVAQGGSFGGNLSVTGSVTVSDPDGRLLAVEPPQASNSNVATLRAATNHPIRIKSGGTGGSASPILLNVNNSDAVVLDTSGNLSVTGGVSVGDGSIGMTNGSSSSIANQYNGNANQLLIWTNRYADGTTKAVASSKYSGAIEYDATTGIWTIKGTSSTQTAGSTLTGDATLLSLNASGVLSYGTYTGTPGTITGYIEIKDIGGTVRKLAVIS